MNKYTHINDLKTVDFLLNQKIPGLFNVFKKLIQSERILLGIIYHRILQ